MNKNNPKTICAIDASTNSLAFAIFNDNNGLGFSSININFVNLEKRVY